MDDPSVSLRKVFSFTENGPKDSSPDRWTRFQARLAQEVKGIDWPAAMPDVAEKICELFDVSVPHLFMASWKKADDLKRLLAESEENPETVRYLELVEHTLRSEHHPYIEAKIRNLTVKKIEFTVTLSFSLKGFVLKIQKGEIQEIQTGRCEVEGKVDYEDLTIAEKKLAPIELPGSIYLNAD